MPYPQKVGEVRPSLMLFSCGVGAAVDLPNLSVMVMGLDDWDLTYARDIVEERLLTAVRQKLGPQVQRLVSPPLDLEEESENPIGVPVASFPRWMRCPECDRLARLDSGLFELKVDRVRSLRSRYVHTNCPKVSRAFPPTVLPARFLVACECGHLDDFPWIEFAHRGTPCATPSLKLLERGVSGTASDIQVVCESCDAKRVMAEAFGEEGKRNMPNCKARHPHLRVYDESGCEQQMRGILLGASNSWFPVTLSAIFVPTARSQIEQLVEQYWVILDKAASIEVLAAFRAIGQLRPFANISDKELWHAIEAKRTGSAEKQEEVGDLKDPEWEILSNADSAMNGPEFSVRTVPVPEPYEKHFSKVVLVERMREVRALVGFTRIESPGDYADLDQLPVGRRAPICRGNPTWVPASEVRGEGIFLQFRESAIVEWSKRREVARWEETFVRANQLWREKRRFAPEQATFPGIRYVLIHSFAHALMRQVALECGYTAASIRERVYSKNPEAEGGPMAGVLLYTAAPDSEGTLGGLVSLGRADELQRHVEQALQKMWLCTSDPLCAEHDPLREPVTLHAAACHACLFASETSCERGNRFLDRSVLVPTFDQNGQAFFDMEQDKL